MSPRTEIPRKFYILVVALALVALIIHIKHVN